MTLHINSSFFTLLMWLAMFPSLLLTLYGMEKMLIMMAVNPKAGYEMDLCFFMDPFTASFLITLMLVSLMILVYSSYYMENDVCQTFYKAMLNLFIVSMVLVAVSPHLVTIILGWDGLGLTSYLLIMYYQNKDSMLKANLTLILNRAGDIFLIMAACFLMSKQAAMMSNLAACFLMSPYMKAGIFLGVGAAMVKAAQLPWSGWLLAAMAAPTPVSSLVHSSTLVCAGVILSARVLEWTSEETGVGAAMAASSLGLFVSSLAAWKEKDIKKIIALSTMNQMSLLLCMVFMKMYYAALAHMLTHAIFKSSLFMNAGSLFHSNSGNQDIRNNTYSMKIFNQSSFMSLWALSALPASAGFFSKENFLLAAMAAPTPVSSLSYFVMISGMLMTLGYTWRLFAMMNFESSLMKKESMSDMNKKQYLSLSVLGTLSLTITPAIIYICNNLVDFSTPIMGLFLALSPLVSGLLSSVFVEAGLLRQMHSMSALGLLSLNLTGFSNLALAPYVLRKGLKLGWKTLWDWEMSALGLL
uniref:NADH-ubiquinone oxidoreductase chain 5 n=1 Tax=Gordius sp. VVA-2019 TaxID=2586752 RepID=A0A514ABU4_9BILA|nr:NADH dehydrogenase subunit 5 [Gordius sp. VVA-2019]